MAPPQTMTWRRIDGRRRGRRRVVSTPVARPPSTHEAVDAVAGEQPRAGGVGRGQVRLASCCGGARAGRRRRRVGHPAGDLLVAPAEAAGAAAQRLAAAGLAPGHGLHGESRSTSSQIAYSSSAVDSRRSACSVRQRSRTSSGRPAVQAAVDLGAAADAAPLGVGDRREADRRRDAAGAVLAVHLLQRERHDLALANVGPSSSTRTSKPASASTRGGRRAAGAGADDERPRPRGAARSRRHRRVSSAVARLRTCRATSPRCRRRPASARGGRTRR